METRTKRSNKGFIIFEIFILILIGLCIYTSYYLDNETKKNKKNIESLKNIYNDKLVVLDNKEKEIKELDKNIEDIDKKNNEYININKTINNTKEEFFKELKKLEDKILKGKSNRKIAYLTFDDGPYYNTYKVLDILDKYDVKATFFTISANGKECFDNKNYNCYKLYNEYIKRGHTIANHTYTHSIFRGLYSSTQNFMREIDLQEKHIKKLTGYKTNIIRFPGGSSTAGRLKDSIIKELRKKGYGWVDWTAEDGDGKGISSEAQGWSNLKPGINNNIEVILFHDYNSVTTKMLPDIIKYLRNNGYELYPLFYESNMVNK